MTEKKNGITLSINPLYTCNFRCSFCYLTKNQLLSKTLLDLEVLSTRMAEISQFREIDHVDLYGGEMTLLPTDYGEKLISLIQKYCKGTINIVTNLSKITSLCTRNDLTLSVSWDGDIQQDDVKVFSNILSIEKDVHILMLASPEMLNWSDEKISDIITMLNSSFNIVSVEIKPYSSNQANQFEYSYSAFEKFIMRWISLRELFKFDFVNESLIRESLEKTKNSWSDDHLYITPEGNLAVLEFDENHNEYFQNLQSFKDYLSWCEKEKLAILSNKHCSSCDYLGSCLSEHLKNQEFSNDSCDGFKGLLNWYKNNEFRKEGR